MSRPYSPTLLIAAALFVCLTGGAALAQTATEESNEGDDAAATAAEPAEGAGSEAEDAEGAEADDETGDADAGAGSEDAAAGEDAGEAGAEDEATAEGAGVSADSVIAVIDGQDLTLGELIALRSSLPEQYQALPDEVLIQGLTEQMVDQTLLAQAAREAGLGDRIDVALSLKNQERAVLADAYLQTEMAHRVTADALRQAYEEKYVNAEPVEEIRAAHILVDSREQAAELKERLDKGEDFAKLAEEFGTDGTASRGGDLGWFAQGDMVPSFGEAAFAMEPGELSEPVESPFGWHLIRVDDRRTRPVPEFEEVQNALLEQVTQYAQAAIVEELRAGAEVEIPEPPPADSIRNDGLLEADG